MKYTGRIVTFFIPPTILVLWFYAYFLIDKKGAYEFWAKGTHIPLDIGFSLLLMPLFWFLGKQYDKTTYLSQKDSLSELYNRRYVLQMFPKLTALIDRKDEKLGVFVLDIDNFKEINDTYGHEVGDKVIQAISKSLVKNTRKTDIVARWGGDEFIVVAPFLNELSPLTILERIEKDLYTFCRKYSINVSVSVGMSTYPVQSLDLDGLVKLADKNMYEVKLQRKTTNHIKTDKPLIS